MASFNKIIMIGNLTKDPDYKQSTSGRGLCKLSIASNRQYKSKQTNALVQEVCFIDVDVWGPQAESCKQYLQKGRPILVEGYLKLDTWESEGQTRRRHLIVADNIVFLGSGKNAAESMDDAGLFNTKSTPSRDNTPSANDSLFSDSPFEDELPF